MPSMRQPLVLVVDDDDEFREEILPKSLKDGLKAKVLTAKNVQAALQIVSEHDPNSESRLDLIVLDMHMPLGDGSVAVPRDAGVRFLKGIQPLPCPVVAVTAYSSFRDCVRAVQAGAAAYLPKEEHDAYCGPEGGIEDLIRTCRRLLDTHDAR